MNQKLPTAKPDWRYGLLLAPLLAILLMAPASLALAQNTNTPRQPTNTLGNLSSSAAVGMPSPLAGISIPTLVGRIVKYILGISGVIAMVMFIYGGLSWMLAQGNQEKITAAKNTVVWAVIGLVLLFTSYTIAKFIIDALSPTGSVFKR